MAGRPFKVGRFAHTLRVRLMREHVGIDVDALSDDEHVSYEDELFREQAHEQWDPNAEQEPPGRQVTESVHERPLRDVLHAVAHEIKQGTRPPCL